MSAILLAGALAAGQAPLPPTGKWHVEYADNMCVLSHDFGDPTKPVTLAFRPWPMANHSQIVILEPESGGAQGELGNAQIALDDTGAGEAEAERFHIEAKHIDVTTFEFNQERIGGLGTAHRLGFTVRRKAMNFALPANTPAALTALESCENDLLTHWGIDPHEKDAIASPPEAASPATWIKQDDYPADALSARQQGTTIMLWTIGIDGRAHDCRIVGSSGSASLDKAACAAILRNGNYRAALGKDGKPMITHSTRRVVWRLPG